MCGRLLVSQVAVLLHLSVVRSLPFRSFAELHSPGPKTPLAMLQSQTELFLKSAVVDDRAAGHVAAAAGPHAEDVSYVSNGDVVGYMQKFNGRTDLCRCQGKNLTQTTHNQTLSPEDALSLYQTTHVIARIFEKLQITYWAGGGTLLGLVRNKGIIPHDNDVDLYITDAQVDELTNTNSALRAAFANNGLIVQACPAGAGVQWWVYTDADRVHKIDVFALHQDYLLQWVHVGSRYAKRKFTATVVKELEPWPFGSSTLMAPPRAGSELYLDQVYGSAWLDQAACVETAHECAMISDMEWDLTGRALPDGPLTDPV